MSDFEDRLTSALRSAGGDAPEPAGLAPAARGRARARRRRTALTSAAVVVAVAGVVGGAALLGNRDGGPTATPPSGGPTPTLSSSPSPAPTSRVESWRDISVTVPTEWGYGHLSTWCLDGKGHPGIPPVVDRPGGAMEAIRCKGPQSGYGISFSDGAAFDAAEPPGMAWSYSGGDVQVYPEDAWIGYQRSDNAMVMVVTPTRDETEQVLGSFASHGDTDPDGNACLPHPPAEATLVPPGQVRLCRYGIDDWLEQSELLTGKDAAAAVAALEAAPTKGDRMCTMALTGPVVLVTSADAEGRVTLDACQGFSWDGAEHDLTADVLYWTLSPGWSGGVEGDVPMPAEFRE